MKIYDHGLSPLLMQNPYSKFILAIKTLPLDRFLKNFADFIATNWDLDADNEIFSHARTVKYSHWKISIRGQILYISFQWIQLNFDIKLWLQISYAGIIHLNNFMLLHGLLSLISILPLVCMGETVWKWFMMQYFENCTFTMGTELVAKLHYCHTVLIFD